MSKIFSMLVLSACTILPLTGLLAQSPVTSPTPSVSTTPSPATDNSAPGLRGAGGGRYRAMLQNLSPEERQKLRQAHQAALADPAVQAAKSSGDKRELHKAMRQAMMRDDPSLMPVLAKMRPKGGLQNAPGGQQGQTVARPQRGMQSADQKIAFLPEDERAKLRNAYSAANSDPQITALRQQATLASTPEVKAQAAKAYRDSVRNSMLRNDPSIAPILQKVHDHNAADTGLDAVL